MLLFVKSQNKKRSRFNHLFKVIGGWLSLKFGPKIVLGITILAASILTVLTPVAAQISFILLVFLRFVIGLALFVNFN